MEWHEKMNGRFLLVLATLTWVCTLTSGVDLCKNIMHGCACQQKAGGGDYEVQCGDLEKPDVEVSVRPEKELVIQCKVNSSSSEHLEKLVGLNVGRVDYVKILRCPMPETPLNELLEKIMGESTLKTTKRLFIQSHGKNLDLKGHFRGFTGLTILQISNNILQDIPEDLLEDMKNLTWLYLLNNEIRMLPQKFLYHTPKLATLELGGNNISEIPDGFFENSKNLTLLNLWGNKLSTLSQSSFESLQNLKSLDLSSSRIQILPSNIFNNLTKLNDLNLSANNFSSLPAEIFQNLKNLTRLRIMDNKAAKLELPDGLFANLTKLGTIFMSRSGITEIPSGLLQNTAGLENLTLSKNKLTSLPSGLFNTARNLSNLDLSNNRINELPDNIFTGLSRLISLHLTNNSLTNLSGSILQSLTMLKELDLSRNKLEHISQSAFQSVENLRSINLSNNNISFSELISDNFGYYSPLRACVLLEKIDISRNFITEIPADWRHTMLKLGMINLSRNIITHLSVQDLHFLSDKLTVDIRYNQVTDIDMSTAEILARNQDIGGEQRASKSRSVSVLLGHNPLNCTSCGNYHLLRYREKLMDNAVYNLVTLVTSELTCSDNRSLSQVPSDNFTCPFPIFDKTCPNGCQCRLQPSQLLFIMQCCEAPSNIPSVGRFNTTKLVSETCTLQEAPNVRHMKGTERIVALLLGNNNITEFRVRHLPEYVEILELHNNNLSQLSEAVLQHLNKSNTLKRLTLAGNPWRCDCEARDLLTYIQSHFKLISDLPSVTCTDGRLLHELATSDLCTDTAVLAASMTIAILGLVLGAIIGLYYHYQNEIKVWLYAHNLCLWFVTEDELDKDKKYDAFVSYSHKDEEFVAKHLVPGLEPPFKLCIHVRDWVAGDWIPEQIARSVQNSRRTLVILSSSFIESVWGRLEFRAAHQQAMSEGRVRVIVILLDDVGPIDKLDPELRTYLTMNTYLQWGDRWFWDKLRYALPHKHDLGGENDGWGWNRRRVGDAPSVLARRIEDKLEQIRTNVVMSPPSPSTNTPPAAINGHAKTIV